MLEDHALHVYMLGGPDFIVGPDAPKEQRNVVGVVQKVGVEVGKKVISMRRRLRELIAYFGGKVIHPVLGLPGGVSKGLKPEDLPQFQELAKDALDFALFTLQVFKDIVLRNAKYVNLITSDAYTHRTYYMGMVDAQQQSQFLRRPPPGGRSRRQGIRQIPRAALPGFRRRARRAVELREVLLPEAARLAWLRGRASRAAFTPSRRWRG